MAHNFSFISQESLSRAMLAAEEDMKQKKESCKNHSVDCVRCQVGQRTKIVNSREYVKRLNRRQLRDSRVGWLILFCICYRFSQLNVDWWHSDQWSWIGLASKALHI